MGVGVGLGLGAGVGEGAEVGEGVGVGDGVGLGVGEGKTLPSGEVVRAIPASARNCTSPPISSDMRITWRARSLFESHGKRARANATSPATSGAAIDVPLHVPYRPLGTVLKIACPGAAT